MLLSIIVPVYNVQEYLHRCVNSLLKDNQDLEYEIILVDDGSTDKSGDICDEYSSSYEYVKSFHKTNGGLSDARNFGLTKACGDYVIFIDSDDYVESGSITKICEGIGKKECDIYCCDYYSLCGSDRTDICYSPVDHEMSGIEYLMYQLQRQTMVSSVVQNIYRRTMLMDNQIYFKKGIYHEDEEWYPRVFLCAGSVAHLGIVYYVYMIRENSIMQQRDLTKHISDFISTMKSLLDYVEGKLSSQQYALLKDNLVDKYLSIYARGQFDGKNRDIILPPKFLRKGLVHKKTKIKALVFNISKNLFCKISRIRGMRR